MLWLEKLKKESDDRFLRILRKYSFEVFQITLPRKFLRLQKSPTFTKQQKEEKAKDFLKDRKRLIHSRSQNSQTSRAYSLQFEFESRFLSSYSHSFSSFANCTSSIWNWGTFSLGRLIPCCSKNPNN